MNDLKIENVKYFLQTDNELMPSTTCFSTSQAMKITNILDINNLAKTYIDCPENSQLEDFITAISQTPEIALWIKNNVGKYGSWMLQYKPVVISWVQAYIFNKLMQEKVGYIDNFTDKGSWEMYCDIMERDHLPITVFGRFGVLNGGGHICCGVGFHRAERIIILHDPYGNVEFDKYKSHTQGAYAEYPVDKYFMRSKSMWLLYATKI